MKGRVVIKVDAFRPSGIVDEEPWGRREPCRVLTTIQLRHKKYAVPGA